MVWQVFVAMMITGLVSLAGMTLLLAWDWLFYRRIPHVKWRMSQLNARERNIVREIIRMERVNAIFARRPRDFGPTSWNADDLNAGG